LNYYLYDNFKYFTIGNLHEARSKLKIAEVRSDLSSTEDDLHTFRKKIKKKSPVRDPPTFSPAKYIEGKL